MALDVRGILKNARLNNNIYMFADEMCANAIDAFLIRKEKQKDVSDLKIKFTTEITDRQLDTTQRELIFKCSDNGVGLGEEQTKAFVTPFTSYKDDLNIHGIGECKGSGRIQYLLYFSEMKIRSIFKKNATNFLKTFSFSDSTTKEIDESSFQEEQTTDTNIGFEITLSSLKDRPRANIQKKGSIETLFSAEKLKNHILVFFLQRLIALKEELGQFEITFESTYKGNTSTTSIKHSDLPAVTAVKTVTFINPENKNKIEFKISHYKLSQAIFQLSKNTVAMCAKSTIVDDITGKYLKGKTQENNPLSGNYHIVLVESDYLDSHVNEQRDGFDLPKNASDREQTFSLLNADISLEETYDTISDVVTEMLSPPDWSKEQLIKRVGIKYGISSSMIAESEIRINANDNEESVVMRVLHKYNEKIMKDTSEIFEIKTEIEKLNPSSEDFRIKINDIAWKHTSSLKKMDMANLSQLVVRRASIIEVLRLAIKEELKIQKDTIKNNDRKNNESLIHNIFFPMKKDSTEDVDHDIWILNEDYNYFDYIASDKKLSQIKLGDELIFEKDIDSELEKIMKKNADSNDGKRPDIAIFGKNGAAIIIEFKAPKVPLDEHTSDLMEYAQLLAAKSKGKLKQFYGYLIGTEVNPNRLRGYTRFANNKGWFGTENIVEHTTNTRLGELYSEILYYDDIADKAVMKLEVYKKKLGLTL